ncbi:hypothetical protein V1512DRAFT_268489 [Lipomyces arxii]|uniref:uncharacterized protein n=1 Tax=Lipomyces arxii TaxID=56418 RepID=UPI0034CFE0CE
MSLTFQHQDRPNRGGNRGGQRQHGHNNQNDRPKKEAILDLAKYQDREIMVKFAGGREVTGILKGYDQLMNLVLDEVVEHLRGEVEEEGKAPEDQTRPLGLVVVRGPLLLLIAPVDGSEEIANPFIQHEVV